MRVTWEYSILILGGDGTYLVYDDKVSSLKAAKALLRKRREQNPKATFVILKDEAGK